MNQTGDLTWGHNAESVAAHNATTNRPLAGRVAVAATRAARRVGLLRHHELPRGEGLWIVPSRGVHTCGMRFAIDVIALDRRGRVIDLVQNLKPWRIRLPRSGCIGVLELPVGSIEESGTRIGDCVRFETTKRLHGSCDPPSA